MNATKKGLLASLIAAALLSGCGGDENISSSNGSETPPGETPPGETPPGGGDGALLLFGVGANASVTPNIQSEKDNWNLQPVTATPVAMTSISAVLINNAGTDDTADVQVPGDGDGTFMLKSDTPLNLSKYASGFIEFQLRTKSTVPEVLNVSIDNEYPNRSSLPIASALANTGDWETLTLPINCMKPFPGATAINLATVGTPFHLATKDAFSYEITNIKYLLPQRQNRLSIPSPVKRQAPIQVLTPAPILVLAPAPILVLTPTPILVLTPVQALASTTPLHWSPPTPRSITQGIRVRQSIVAPTIPLQGLAAP